MKKILISIIACSCICFGFASADEVTKNDENVEMSIIQSNDDKEIGKEILPPEANVDSKKSTDAKKWDRRKDFANKNDDQKFKGQKPDAKDKSIERPNRPEKENGKDFAQRPNRPRPEMNKDFGKRPNRPDFKNGDCKCKKDCKNNKQFQSKDKKRKSFNNNWKNGKKNFRNHNMPVVRKNNKR